VDCHGGEAFQGRHDACFANESKPIIRIMGEMVGQEFDGDVLLVDGVASAIDFAMGAMSEAWSHEIASPDHFSRSCVIHIHGDHDSIDLLGEK